jgi:DNA processing protein
VRVPARADVLVLAPGAPSWPARLDTIEGPPERLWVRGRVERLVHVPLVAVVGTRAPTPYGELQAARFARALVAAGVGIVSGLARGVDEAAHRAALEAGGTTVAVLGCGVDRPWPVGELAERVASEGALVSELAPGTPPRRHHFPRRNRLISGLAEAVLVVEAAFASGSLITARWAADQGRTVLAVPGRVDHPMARGCHRLLREGALFAEDPEDVLRELGLDPAGTEGTQRIPAARELEPLLAALRGETLHADELAARTGTPLADVLTRLVELELGGAVARAPGGLWRLE